MLPVALVMPTAALSSTSSSSLSSASLRAFLCLTGACQPYGTLPPACHDSAFSQHTCTNWWQKAFLIDPECGLTRLKKLSRPLWP